MEKLIELLNECTNGRFKTEQDLRLCIEMRGYCRDFCKWLVENDKIDTSKYNFCAEVSGVCGDVYKNYGAYESLLMLLTIQDEPIRFLCDILK